VKSAYPELELVKETPIPQMSVQANSMLGSIFRNLLKNAIQHNDKETPKAAVSATDRDDTVVVRIADNGPGIPDSRKDTVFGKGEKGLDSQGTGIGLYLVETLIENYGGDIWIEDRENRRLPGEQPEVDDGAEEPTTDTRSTADDEREGAVFVVELPKAELE
jgi:signal transduction histidine kinase